ncbi:MAG TPA: oxidoreductase, partial [Nocardioides sp.]
MPTPDPTTVPRPARLRHGAYGVLATLAGLGVAHLAAALTVPAASPVLAVGSTVIDLTPTPVKEWAVATFGTADKPILVGSVFLVVLLLAAVAGIVGARRIRPGVAVLVALAAVAAAAALLRPGAGPLDALPGAVAALVGGAALAWLHRADAPAAGPGEGAAGPSRRGVVVAAGTLA